MHGEEGRAMAAAETILRSSSDFLVRDSRQAHEAEEKILIQVTLIRPTGSRRAWELIMFNHRLEPRALLICDFLGVTLLLLIVAGSYDVSADLNSEFVKGKSEFYYSWKFRESGIMINFRLLHLCMIIILFFHTKLERMRHCNIFQWLS